jgi:hypothetical protein
MSDTYILAIDLAKHSFQVCATVQGGAVLFNRMVWRAKLESLGLVTVLRRSLISLRHLGFECERADAAQI